MNDNIPVRAGGVHLQLLRNRALLVKGAAVYEISDHAARIWDLSDGTKSVTDITNELCAEYADANREQVASESLEFIEELSTLGLMAWKE